MRKSSRPNPARESPEFQCIHKSNLQEGLVRFVLVAFSSCRFFSPFLEEKVDLIIYDHDSDSWGQKRRRIDRGVGEYIIGHDSFV